MQKITPFLWFEDNAEEAVDFYVSIFKSSRKKAVSYYPESVAEAAKRTAGSVMIVSFELDGQEFVAMNGGPAFKFNEAISFVVNCDTQDEIDYYWEKLTADGGQEIQCGWLKDKYGLAWQITPTFIFESISSEDPEKTNRVMQAVMTMKKLDLEQLKRASG